MSKLIHTAAVVATIAVSAGVWLHAQEPDQTTFHVKVDMVVLSFSVTDTKSKYVNGLTPKDFKVFEDDIPEKLATFAEGSHALMQVLTNGETKPFHNTVTARLGRCLGIPMW